MNKLSVSIKSVTKLVGNLAYWLVVCFLVVIASLTGISAINVPGGIRLYSVESGSMEPTIHTGSIVISQPSDSYKKGDVITFKAEKDRALKYPKTTTTHRIFEVGMVSGVETYTTKGDANNYPDVIKTSKDLVLGKVIFSIPLIGYPIAFAKTFEGLVILVIIPSTLIIYSELISIKGETKKLLEKRRQRKLSLQEKVEVGIGEEEIKVEKWYRKILRHSGKTKSVVLKKKALKKSK